ncbi:hypothetical protein [Bacillus cereus]|uniref:hypothetical protein n=1 Tax=Bacillus cereus TaxID=1396 RepID=UPI00039D2203|nr:hypothetical protein [Bacillus cereus]
MVAMTTNNTFTKMIMVFMFTTMVMMFMLTTMIMMLMLTAIIIPIHFYTSYRTRVILFYVLIGNMLVY